MKLATGVRRLDEQLKGGLPERSSTLLYGPPFIGKEVLLRQFLLTSLRAGMPSVAVLTDGSWKDLRNLLAASEPTFSDYEKAGLVRYVDTYSRGIGITETHPSVEFVDGLMNFNAVSLAVNNAERDFIRTHAQHALVFDSVSTLIAYTNAGTAFRYLQVLLGKTKAAGATSLLTLSQGMHTDAEVQMVKHLVDGMIELKGDQGKNVLHVDGLGVTDSRGWVEYQFSEAKLEVTGSFTAGRIR
ncbi:MAG TPA: RAD55 family ATPase [Candidatus Thermoplasmatota archaeon]|nr:RAD55 family ATPase [Candidatus Thermoplasmatota archaeon]